MQEQETIQSILVINTENYGRYEGSIELAAGTAISDYKISGNNHTLNIGTGSITFKGLDSYTGSDNRVKIAVNIYRYSDTDGDYNNSTITGTLIYDRTLVYANGDGNTISARRLS